jgi:CMP-N-acetylneuraminic acid synthetase
MTTALILAGKREGTLDPLAEAAGVQHKCIVPVAGRPMIAHVVEALAAALEIGTVLISIDDVNALDDVPEVRDGVARGRIGSSRPRKTLSTASSPRSWAQISLY